MGRREPDGLASFIERYRQESAAFFFRANVDYTAFLQADPQATVIQSVKLLPDEIDGRICRYLAVTGLRHLRPDFYRPDQSARLRPGRKINRRRSAAKNAMLQGPPSPG